MSLQQLLATGERAAAAAMPVIMDWYRRSEREVRAKDDDSPVTAADLAAHRAIMTVLARETPGLPVLSEEAQPPEVEERLGWPRYWLVDPLDGTREFIARNGEFTVNIALIEAGRPVLGIVAVPVRDEIYLGSVPDRLAVRVRDGQREVIRVRPCPVRQPRLLATRSHGNAALQHVIDGLRASIGELSLQPMGSALKLVELACGEADGYPRCSPCSEWDIAAGEALLLAAGGVLLDRRGQPLRYNRPETVLHPDFWAAADPAGAVALALGRLMGSD